MVKEKFQNDSRQTVARIRQTWSNLSEDEIACYEEGARETFLNAVQRKYGLSKERAEKILNNIERQTREAA